MASSAVPRCIPRPPPRPTHSSTTVQVASELPTMVLAASIRAYGANPLRSGWLTAGFFVVVRCESAVPVSSLISSPFLITHTRTQGTRYPPGARTEARLTAQRGVTVVSGRCGDGASKSGRRWTMIAAAVADRRGRGHDGGKGAGSAGREPGRDVTAEESAGGG